MKDFFETIKGITIGGALMIAVAFIGGALGIPILKEMSEGFRFLINATNQSDQTLPAINAESAAHSRVLNAYIQVDTGIPPGASPKEGIAALRSYHSSLLAISLSGCSPEFRSDFVALINSVAEVIAELERFVVYRESLPDDFVGGFLMGALNGLTRGEIDGGATRIQNELDQANQKFQIAVEKWQRAITVLKKYE